VVEGVVKIQFQAGLKKFAKFSDSAEFEAVGLEVVLEVEAENDGKSIQCIRLKSKGLLAAATICSILSIQTRALWTGYSITFPTLPPLVAPGKTNLGTKISPHPSKVVTTNSFPRKWGTGSVSTASGDPRGVPRFALGPYL
jgi:hypothetical protein